LTLAGADNAGGIGTRQFAAVPAPEAIVSQLVHSPEKIIDYLPHCHLS
jgi:hypothetical protein